MFFGYVEVSIITKLVFPRSSIRVVGLCYLVKHNSQKIIN